MMKPYVQNEESQQKKTKIERRLYRNAEIVAKFYKFIKILPVEDDNLANASNKQHFKKNYKYEPKDFC